ncbi:MAG: family 78 glycoside hydrolase catalytic domain [Ignavibacteria bacterium]|jgi:alpha-L-rhamnosidase
MKQNIKLLVRTIIVVAIILFACTNCSNTDENLNPVYLRCEYKVNPVVNVFNPRLSWILESEANGQVQTAYRILVASSLEKLKNNEGDLWDTQKVAGDKTYQIKYEGKPLNSRQECYWKVMSWDKDGIPGEWSEPAKWEMGLLDKDEWKGEWIGNDLNDLGKGEVYHLPPAPYVRKEIEVKEKIKKARLYVTALGLYEFYINGDRIGEDYLTPGWTDYNKRVYYQTYDVTENLKEGKNAIGSIISYGWYSGYIGYALLVGNPKVKNFYGDVPVLMAQLEIEYEDGQKEIVVTDKTWKTNHGPIIESDILNGETYDARKEFKGWSEVEFDDDTWKNVETLPRTERKIEFYPGNTIQVTETLTPQKITPYGEDKYLFSMGQNFAGIIKLKVKGNAGDTVVIRYGEMLFPDGRLMTENLRKARAIDTYILKGNPDGEEYIPRFTYHGFQYVLVDGLREVPDENTLTGFVLGSNTPVAGSFECSDLLINKLYSNIVWTQRSNFVEVPTDCPQRDERLGWTGDAQVYISSAALNMDISAFFTKWLVDLNDAQMVNGAYPHFAPFPPIREADSYCPGWMEAGVICPYQIYKSYGDTEVIKKHWVELTKFMKFLESKSKGKYYFSERSFDDIVPKGGYGDWLSIGKNTSPDMLATMYFAYCSDLMIEMAEAIGNKEGAKYYADLSKKIRKGFLKHYVASDGKLKCNEKAYGDGKGYNNGELGFSGHTQTAYANAIYMNMLPDSLIPIAGEYLAKLVEENGGYLTTGFLGAKQLLPALSATGNSELAYQLLLNKGYPSWCYEIVNGATTIWERWNSYTQKEGFVSGMNSFNHYAFGAVCEWMFGNMAGLKNKGVAYKHIQIKPEILNQQITSVKVTSMSMNGKIISSWERNGENITMNVTIPVNSKAEIFIPTSNAESVLLNGSKLKNQSEAQFIDFEDNTLSVVVGSGTYTFESAIK